MWFTGVRRDEAPTRTNTPLITWDEAYGLVKVNPMVGWTFDQLIEYSDDNILPVNPLPAARATRPSAASPAPARWPPVKTPAPAAGQDPTRQNADYTHEQR